ncbi:unnamed protein product [Phytophthora lilii]|uniref:Unnamed protein product n=1 Tax=Phytophthora lilii TaxID=2077276 RepID=A0A9W6TF73_9STRA|nr:unnamed protein product [Phytophthora lilii]
MRAPREPLARSSKGKWLTIAQKYAIVLKHQEEPTLSHAKLALWAQLEFQLPDAPGETTVRRIIKTADTIKHKHLHATTAKGRTLHVRCPQLERELGRFVAACEAQHVCLSRRLMTAKARRILDGIENAPAHNLSDGWLTGFMRRHGLRFREMHGEAASVDPADVLEAKLAMQDVTRHYALCDVWNMDESGLTYRAAKQKGICKSKTSGLKKDKTRITMALAANADGSEKREVFFIGRARRPHCYNKKDARELGFDYGYNKKAWMTKSLYSRWVRAFDVEMKAADRHILLLLDNASSHGLDDIESGELTNITVQKLPPNTTSHVQPMDAGIIATLKSSYKAKHMELAVNRADPDMPDTTPAGRSIYYVDQLQAMQWIREAWEEMELRVIEYCFRKTGVVFASDKENEAPPRREKVSMGDLLI